MRHQLFIVDNTQCAFVNRVASGSTMRITIWEQSNQIEQWCTLFMKGMNWSQQEQCCQGPSLKILICSSDFHVLVVYAIRSNVDTFVYQCSSTYLYIFHPVGELARQNHIRTANIIPTWIRVIYWLNHCDIISHIQVIQSDIISMV